MPTVNVTKSVVIDKSAADVWKLITETFAQEDKIAANIVACAALTDGTTRLFGDNNNVTGRTITLADGTVMQEVLTAVDPNSMKLSYDIIGMVFPFVTAKCCWWVAAVGHDGNNHDDKNNNNKKSTLFVQLQGAVNWIPVGFVVPLLQYMVVPSALQGVLEDHKYYVENDSEPSPTKKKAMAKTQK